MKRMEKILGIKSLSFWQINNSGRPVFQEKTGFFMSVITLCRTFQQLEE